MKQKTTDDPPKPAAGGKPQGLISLFDRSWEMELLISGFLSFGLWTASGEVLKLTDLIEVQDWLGSASEDRTNIILTGLIFLAGIACKMLSAHFIAHLFLRGYWVGLLGLQNALPSDDDYTNAGYNPIFARFLKKRASVAAFAVKLDKVCSGLFAFSFLVVFIAISVAAYSAFFMLIIAATAKFDFSEGFILNFEENDSRMGWFYFIYFLLSFIYFVDFGLASFLKRRKNRPVSWIYFWIYRLFSFITLGFLYRPLYYRFANAAPRWFFLLVAPVYLIVIVVLSDLRPREQALIADSPYQFLPWLEVEPPGKGTDGAAHAAYYADRRDETLDRMTPDAPMIDSETAGGDQPFVRLFVPFSRILDKVAREKKSDKPEFKRNNPLHQKIENSGFFEIEEIDSAQAVTGEPDRLDDLKLKLLQQTIYTMIDDSAAPTKFYYQRRPIGPGYRAGLVGFFSIKELSDGPHELRVQYLGKQDSVFADYAIPFWVY